MPERQRPRGRGPEWSARWIMAAILFVGPLLAGCQTVGGLGRVGEDNPGEVSWELRADWAERVLAEVTEKYPATETRLFFTARPRLSKLRYHYWTEKSYVGLAGLAVVRSFEEGGLFGGESGPWQVVYVLDPDGQVEFLSGRLEWIEVTPPLYALETIDETGRSAIRLARPVDLDAQTEGELTKFMSTPFKELTEIYNNL